MSTDNIRNFSIIAHIDHGKSTLSDRLLEVTETVEKRKMKDQVLDQMDLERERGITIKMQPVRMEYHSQNQDSGIKIQESYILNLIDTPGHIDFSYEVSRSLRAVEGVLLLVDATQGVQAQTFTVLEMAREAGLVIIPVINKIDLPVAQVEEVKEEIVELLDCDPDSIIAVSGKTGDGAPELLEEIVKKIPPPQSEAVSGKSGVRSLVFDSEFSTHQGVIAYVRVMDGEIKKGDKLSFVAGGEKFPVLELGTFQPEKRPVDKLSAGEIGYLMTGIRQVGQAKVGDTIIDPTRPLPAIPGYVEPRPVVWASVYPEGQDDFNNLKQALERLQLSDASLSFAEESSNALGRGFRCGFLGLLHLEIITERLKREFSLELVIATPTIGYRIKNMRTGKSESVYSPHLFPDASSAAEQEVHEPWVSAKIITPPEYLNAIIKLFNDHEIALLSTINLSSSRVMVEVEMPLRELMRNFFDNLKSVSSGFASFSYQLSDERLADVTRLDILVNNQVVPAFSRVISRRRAQTEAEAAVERLRKIMPKQLIVVKLQAKALGRILAARSISALRKDVTGYLYGGDVTRKKKLLEKQKKGKKKMQARGSVNIPASVFLKMVSSEK
ncbi:MAG: translation elongation factor 4 [Patescibacteria group bacterium]|nr:translation elongation factor 4 [Patescibacteria group bacterium]